MKRREFLTLPLVALLPAWLRPGRAMAAERNQRYAVEVGILYDVFSLHLSGAIIEEIEPAAGRYVVQAQGQGPGITHRLEASGRLREGRWAPLRTASRLEVRGRESQLEAVYDYDRGRAILRGRSETWWGRRPRVVDDVIGLPPGHVDDVVSAALNYADERWPPAPDGAYHTRVVRRQPRAREDSEEADPAARAEVVPLVLRIVLDPTGGRARARLDLTRFSAWARADRPAEVVFGPDRRLESIRSSLILGTSLSIRLGTV